MSNRSSFLLETAEFNCDKFSGKEAEIGDVLALAQTMPFLNDWRVIIVTDIHEITAQAQNQMLAYFSNPNRTTCLIMTTEKLDSRTKFAQALKQSAEIVQFWKLLTGMCPGGLVPAPNGMGTPFHSKRRPIWPAW